ncbi:hypothetical protein CFSAN001627_21629 [Clostridium botulinum CFSAN001627]|uniref:Uncharacterized protein n=1 Tax=Clostridium botulinum CFSAN001627 TaxID=1232189 RepID=M1ZU62_CLOBO|nr:hypothetical protein CFSAN001627_21629 [Clostridium botulinum CFSAN001627]EPS49432.1 hypothetical protein CFSAN002369_11347 [Clostridium botulinum CFSAN002369]EPS49607.1 hypothetical protein CFSAN002368_17490 [Clostridium botulinum A1 str. CFSAN002368]EPS50661.1 hypothetical protein CFSAN002367_10474 [Clostridium botulinum CFSAN002367]
MACVITSIPVSAVIALGTDLTNSGSRIATVGRSDLSVRAYFNPSCLFVITAYSVTSEPVPLVVGIA